MVFISTSCELVFNPVAKNFTFMQKGVSGNWKEILSENDHAYICQVSEKILLEFGYAK